MLCLVILRPSYNTGFDTLCLLIVHIYHLNKDHNTHVSDLRSNLQNHYFQGTAIFSMTSSCYTTFSEPSVTTNSWYLLWTALIPRPTHGKQPRLEMARRLAVPSVKAPMIPATSQRFQYPSHAAMKLARCEYQNGSTCLVEKFAAPYAARSSSNLKVI